MSLATKLKPARGFSYFLHVGLNVLLPAIIFVLVRINFLPLALIVILLSKWRMFAVRPRYWLANIRANAVDIIVKVSILAFMTSTSSSMWQLGWTVLYGIWLIFLKPVSSPFGVSLQSMAAQLIGLMALFLKFSDASLAVLVLASWAIAYSCARHFLSSFDERLTPLLSYLWAYFAAALVWVLSHWLLFYGRVAQPTLLLTVIGYGLGTLYYLYETDRLSKFVRRQIVLIMVATVVVILAFSDWGDKAI